VEKQAKSLSELWGNLTDRQKSYIFGALGGAAAGGLGGYALGGWKGAGWGALGGGALVPGSMLAYNTVVDYINAKKELEETGALTDEQRAELVAKEEDKYRQILTDYSKPVAEELAEKVYPDYKRTKEIYSSEDDRKRRFANYPEAKSAEQHFLKGLVEQQMKFLKQPGGYQKLDYFNKLVDLHANTATSVNDVPWMISKGLPFVMRWTPGNSIVNPIKDAVAGMIPEKIIGRREGPDWKTPEMVKSVAESLTPLWQNESYTSTMEDLLRDIGAELPSKIDPNRPLGGYSTNLAIGSNAVGPLAAAIALIGAGGYGGYKAYNVSSEEQKKKEFENLENIENLEDFRWSPV